jgi:hypothetical protein
MSRSLLTRSLEPLAASLWGLFLGWTVLLAWVWLMAIDAEWVRREVSNEGLKKALEALVKTVVPAWLGLAAAVMHLTFSRAEGMSTARRWLWLVLAGGFALGLLARNFEVPFGSIHFMPFVSLDHKGQSEGYGPLGPYLLGVPIGWALLWFVLVAGARELVLWFFPRASHGAATRAGGVLVALTFLNLEPLAHGWRWRWWFWYEGKWNVAASPQWAIILVAALALSWLLRQTSVAPRVPQRSRKPAIIFLIFNLLLLAAHLRFWAWPPAPPELIEFP